MRFTQINYPFLCKAVKGDIYAIITIIITIVYGASHIHYMMIFTQINQVQSRCLEPSV